MIDADGILRCPRCHSDDLEVSVIETEDGNFTKIIYNCLDCEREFAEVFSFSGFEEADL